MHSREKKVAIYEAKAKSKIKVDAVTIEKSKAETKKPTMEANLIEEQTAQASDDRIFNLFMKWKQLKEAKLIEKQTAQASDDRIFNLFMKWKQLKEVTKCDDCVQNQATQPCNK